MSPSENGRTNLPCWLSAAAILAMPLALLFHQDNSLFTPPGQIDSWFYLGYFRNLVEFKRDLFPDTYYGSRLAWLLPGHAIHTILNPVVATVVLHLGVVYAGAIALFATLRLTVGSRAALLTTLMYCANPQMWFASQTDYVDGETTALCLAAMALLTLAAREQRGIRYLFAAGVAAAGLVYANYFWIVLLPFLGLYYLGLLWCWRRTSYRRSILYAILATAAGFLFVTVTFCAINYRLDGNVWFYRPSMRIVSGLVKTHPFYRSPWLNYGLAPWLWLTAAMSASAILGIALSWRTRKQPDSRIVILFSALLLLVVGFFVYLQFGWTLAPLGMPYYASDLLPFVFLAAGGLFWRTARDLSAKSLFALTGGSILLLALIWADYGGSFTPIWPAALLPVAVAGTGALLASVAMARRTAALVLVVVGFACFASETRFIPNEQMSSERSHLSDPHAYRTQLVRLMKARSTIESLRNGDLYFWYDEHEAPGLDYIALNSTYLYRYRRISKPFPELTCDARIQADTLVVVTTQTDRAPEIAAGKLSNCLAPAALYPQVLTTFRTVSPYGAYTTAIIVARRDLSKWHVLQPSAAAAGPKTMQLAAYSRTGEKLPSEGWRVMNSAGGASLQPVRGGLALRTADATRVGAASYGPFVVSADGRYDFVLHVTPRFGKFAFGVISEGRWLCADNSTHSWSERLMKCSAELKKGQSVELHLANINEKNEPTSLVLNELTAVEVDR